MLCLFHFQHIAGSESDSKVQELKNSWDNFFNFG